MTRTRSTPGGAPAATLSLLLLAGCTLPKMAVKPGLAAQEPFDLPVFGAGASVRFGPFQVKDVDRSAFDSTVTTRSVPLLWPDWVKSLGEMEAHQDYAFAVEEAGQQPLPVRCRADMSGSKARLSGGVTISSSTQILHCALGADPAAAEPARLDLADGKGTVRAGARTLAIEARDLRGSSETMSPAGYALAEGGRDLAVAQTVNGGAAWLASDLDARTRALAAAATAALLLYRPPETR